MTTYIAEINDQKIDQIDDPKVRASVREIVESEGPTLEAEARIIPGEPGTRHHPGCAPDVDVVSATIGDRDVRDVLDVLIDYESMAEEMIENAHEDARMAKAESKLESRRDRAREVCPPGYDGR